jgi:cell wall-associated NlpC family hydrolase
MTEIEQRARVIAVAMSWEQTPFAWGACVKGAGVDCGRFLGAVFTEAGVCQVDLDHIDQPPPQWFKHRASGSYLNIIRSYAAEYSLAPGQHPQMADIVVAKYGFDWAHSAIVIAWPKVIAAVAAELGTVTVWPSLLRSPQYAGRPLKYFDAWRPR